MKDERSIYTPLTFAASRHAHRLIPGRGLHLRQQGESPARHHYADDRVSTHLSDCCISGKLAREFKYCR